MLIVSGNTFPHRETLKGFGGRWNSETKTWTVPSAARSVVKTLSGVVVRDAATETKTTLVIPQTIMGDSTEYLNTFGKSTNFAGFSSIRAMVDFIENIPASIKDAGYNRGTAWKHNENFKGTATMEEAIDLALNGWRDGIHQARDIAERIAAKQPECRQRRHGVAGGSVNVSRMLAGNPMHMRHRTKQPSDKIIRLVNDVMSAAGVNRIHLSLRAAIIAAIIDTLENNGYRCEIVSAAFNPYGFHSDTKDTAVTAVKLKNADEPLNLSNIMFGCGHPSFFRRFFFAQYACIEGFPYGPMGRTASITLANDDPNTFVLGKINLADARELGGLPMTERIRATARLVVPDNLPVTLEL